MDNLLDSFTSYGDLVASVNNGTGVGIPLQIERGERYHLAAVTVLLIICVLGLIGNVFAITILLLSKDFIKSTTSWYLLQIALANTLFLLTLPFKVSEELNARWIFSSDLCKAKETVLFLNYYASILFITIMTVDQYLIVRNAYKLRERNLRTSRPIAYVITAITWAVSLAFCIPVILYSDKLKQDQTCICAYQFPIHVETPEEFCAARNMTSGKKLENCLKWAPSPMDNKCVDTEVQANGTDAANNFIATNSTHGLFNLTLFYDHFDFDYPTEDLDFEDFNIEEADYVGPDCHYHHNGIAFKAFLLFNFIVMFLVPFLVMSVLYSLIAYHIRHKENVVRSPTENGLTGNTSASITINSETKRKRVALMCVVIVGIFVVCWLPFHAVHLAKMVGIPTTFESNLCANLSIASSMLAFAHAAINPYLYMVARGKKRILRVFTSGKHTVMRATSQFTRTIVINSSPNGVDSTPKINGGQKIEMEPIREEEDQKSMGSSD